MPREPDLRLSAASGVSRKSRVRSLACWTPPWIHRLERLGLRLHAERSFSKIFISTIAMHESSTSACWQSQPEMNGAHHLLQAPPAKHTQTLQISTAAHTPRCAIHPSSTLRAFTCQNLEPRGCQKQRASSPTQQDPLRLRHGKVRRNSEARASKSPGEVRERGWEKGGSQILPEWKRNMLCTCVRHKRMRPEIISLFCHPVSFCPIQVRVLLPSGMPSRMSAEAMSRGNTRAQPKKPRIISSMGFEVEN